MRSTPSLLLLLASAAISGCADATAPLATSHDGPNMARQPANPGALWELHGHLGDGTPAGITGDGRDASGTGSAVGSTGAYQGGLCGVRTVIFVHASASGDATIDPDADYNNRTKCARRHFNLAIGSGIQGSPFTNARGVWFLPDGGEKLERMQWQIDLDGCYRIRFENVRITRLPDVDGKRVWSVETTDHTAVCWDLQGATWVEIPDRTYTLPYSLTITER